jgi:hypothetical protein
VVVPEPEGGVTMTLSGGLTTVVSLGGVTTVSGSLSTTVHPQKDAATAEATTNLTIDLLIFIL